MASVRLLTANLFTGRASVASFSDVLDRVKPDLVVCQEVGSDMARFLESRFSHGFVSGDDDHYEGRAMVSDLGIDVAAVPMPHRDGLRTCVRVGGMEVTVIGVHLANPINGWGAVWRRRDQVGAILNLTETLSSSSVVVGDLNATPLWPAYRRLRTQYRDGVRDASRKAMFPIRTWAPTPGLPSVLRIDHILTKGVALTDVSVHRVDGSDHRALAATLIE